MKPISPLYHILKLRFMLVVANFSTWGCQICLSDALFNPGACVLTCFFQSYINQSHSFDGLPKKAAEIFLDLKAIWLNSMLMCI